MKKYFFFALITLSLATTWANAGAEPDPFPFDTKQLAGVWVDSVNTEQACSIKNWHFTYQFSQDNRRLSIKFDRPISSAVGENVSQLEASITSATSRTLTLRYDTEKRRTANGKPVEWQLAIVAPGVYRWHATEWPADQVNLVVGIRCRND